jgi:hypothetical protein
MSFDDTDLELGPLSPVALTDEQVAEFQQIMKEESGEELTLEQARIKATQLIGLTRMLLRPLPKETTPAPVVEHQLLQKLEDLKKELPRTKGRPMEWQWAVPMLWECVQEALVTAIKQKRAPRESSNGSNFVRLPDTNLVKLLAVARREVKVEIPSYLDSAIHQLDLLKADPGLPAQAWKVLAPDLPRIARDCLEVVAIMGWKLGLISWQAPEERGRAQVLDDEICALLLGLEDGKF